MKHLKLCFMISMLISLIGCNKVVNDFNTIRNALRQKPQEEPIVDNTKDTADNINSEETIILYNYYQKPELFIKGTQINLAIESCKNINNYKASNVSLANTRYLISEVMSVISKNNILVIDNTSYVLYVHSNKKLDYVDNESFISLVIPTDKTYSYINIQGGKSTVRVVNIANEKQRNILNNYISLAKLFNLSTNPKEVYLERKNLSLMCNNLPKK